MNLSRVPSTDPFRSPFPLEYREAGKSILESIATVAFLQGDYRESLVV